MKAKYLIRFDDICPTMNWAVWDRVEDTLLRLDIRPIVAIIPENRDPSFHIERPREDFWQRVRQWVKHGWTIGLHGCHHEYLTKDAGILGKNQFSEFAGLPRQMQQHRLRYALNIFEREAVEPTVWVAPGHSFDENTLAVLRDLGIVVVSDGYTIYPSVDPHGTLWIPQQLWSFQPLPCGVWTICLHHNSWSGDALKSFKRDVERFRDCITHTEQVIADYRGRTANPLDHVFAHAVKLRLKLGPKVRGWIPHNRAIQTSGIPN